MRRPRRRKRRCGSSALANPFKKTRWYSKLSNIFAAPGYRIQAMPRGFVLLTVTGRKTGKKRHRPVRAIRLGDTFYATSMLGERSDWLRNVRKDPAVTLKYGRKTVPAMAREVTDAKEQERASQAYTETVFPFDRFDYAIVDWWVPTRKHIVEAHREWLDGGVLVALDVEAGA